MTFDLCFVPAAIYCNGSWLAVYVSRKEWISLLAGGSCCVATKHYLGPVTKRRGVDPQPGPDLAARIQDGDLITNSGFSTIQPHACRLRVDRFQPITRTKPLILEFEVNKRRQKLPQRDASVKHTLGCLWYVLQKIRRH